MMKKILAGLSLAIMLAACSQMDGAGSSQARVDAFLENSNLRRAESTDKIPGFTLNGWKYIDHYSLVILTKGNGKYLVGLSNYCQYLSNPLTIRTTSTTDSLTTFDSIVARKDTQRSQKCPIDKITRLESTGDRSPPG